MSKKNVKDQLALDFAALATNAPKSVPESGRLTRFVDSSTLEIRRFAQTRVKASGIFTLHDRPLKSR